MRYFIGFLVAIGLIILLIVLLFGGSGSSKKATPTAPKSLISYANTDATVRLTIEGPVSAPQNRDEVQITVGRDQASFEQLQGYDGDVVNLQTFPNTVNSYAIFLRSIALGGFTEGNNDPALADNRGYCSVGLTYVFELDQDGTNLQRYWATNCGKPKTFEGNVSLMLTLFQAQIPDYNALTSNVNF